MFIFFFLSISIALTTAFAPADRGRKGYPVLKRAPPYREGVLLRLRTADCIDNKDYLFVLDQVNDMGPAFADFVYDFNLKAFFTQECGGAPVSR